MTSTSGQAERLKRVDPLERVLNLFTLLHRLTTPLTREQIVAQMARGMTPTPLPKQPKGNFLEATKTQLCAIFKTFYQRSKVQDVGCPLLYGMTP